LATQGSINKKHTNARYAYTGSHTTHTLQTSTAVQDQAHTPNPHLAVKLHVLCLLVANHDWVDEMEVKDGDHVILCWLKEGVADVAVHHIKPLTLGVGVPGTSSKQDTAAPGTHSMTCIIQASMTCIIRPALHSTPLYHLNSSDHHNTWQHTALLKQLKHHLNPLWWASRAPGIFLPLPPRPGRTQRSGSRNTRCGPRQNTGRH
jgi:hypothetical protein